MTRPFATLALLLLAPLLAAAPVPKSVRKTPPDSERILGEWEVYDDEKKVGQGSGVVWTFTEGKMHSSSGNSNWTIKLDVEQSPKQIDIVGIGGQSTYPGIFEFDGDKLKIAYTTGRTRPTEFTSANGVCMNVLVRKKDGAGK